MFDWLIVGAGFAGTVIAERLASQRDEKVLVIDLGVIAVAREGLCSLQRLLHALGESVNSHRVKGQLASSQSVPLN